MKSASSKLLPLLIVLVVGAIGSAAWLFLSDGPSQAADPFDAPRLGALESAPASAAGGVAAVDAEDEAADTAVLPAAQTESERRAQATAAEAELATAIWLEGQLIFPEGTPYGEVVEVVALGRKFKNREMHRTKVEPDGKFRVAFALGTKSGRLDVDALHLFLDKPLTVRLSEGKQPKDLKLEPFLGGAVRGQLQLAPGAERFAAELVGKSVRANAWSSRWSNMVSRAAKVDKDLRFELRGLPPELGLNLEFDSDVVAKLAVEDVRAPAGETLERSFELDVGARVRGRVRSAEGALPKNTTLSVSVKGAKSNDFGSNRDHAKLAEDGSFDLRGLAPGEITLTAAAPQRVTHKLEIGRVDNGATKEGVELTLGLGHMVSGRILWPDKSPAVEANVVVTGGGGDDDPFNPFDTRFAVRSNALGEFQITGLNAGPYGLLAQAKPRAEDGARKKGPTWKARLENVAPDTRGLDVELVAGYSIEGQVVDDVGAPVKAFGVVAMAKDEGKRSFNIARMVSGMFKPEDGKFELGGLLEGGYTVNLNVPGHDDPKPQDVSVPADGAFYTFVAPRRATISGVVLRPDGSPAPRAEVVVNGDQGRWSDFGEDKANNQGEFTIKAAKTGKVKISASLLGFAPSEAQEIELVGGESLGGLRLALRVGGRITGEVLPSRSGERVDGRKVSASLDEGDHDADSTTDRGGKFTIENLPPGVYSVSAEAATTELDQLRSPGARRGNDWELLELTKKRGKATVADGGSAHVVLGAPPASPVIVSGVVRRGTTGVPELRVVAQSDGDHGWERRKLGRTDANGQYQITLDEPGKYQIQVSSGGRGGTLVGKHIDVPAAGASGIDFALAGGRISGVVAGPDGEELGWVNVSLSRAPGAKDDLSGWTGGNIQTDSEGRFDFRDLPAGEFKLVVSGSSWNRRTFEQRQYGKVQREVSLAEGQELSDLQIQMEAAGTLKVSVLLPDGAPAPNGRLQVTPSAGGSIDQSWFSDGEETREDMLPGDYEIRATSDEYVSARAERVSIAASQTTTATLQLRRGGWVKFKAVDGEGQEIGAFARLYDSSGRELASEMLMNGQRSSVLPTGSVRVVATSSEGKIAEANARVEAGETAEVLLSFSD